MSTTAKLSARLADVEREIEAIRRELAEIEARRLPPATELASRLAGRPVSAEEMRKRGRARRDEIIAHLKSQ